LLDGSYCLIIKRRTRARENTLCCFYRQPLTPFFFNLLLSYLQPTSLLEKPSIPLLAIRATAAQQSRSLLLALAVGPDSLFAEFALPSGKYFPPALLPVLIAR
jgi:hypothetical protein